MSAEDHFDVLSLRKTGERVVDSLDQSVKVKFIPVEIFNEVDRHIRAKETVPFVKAAPSCRRRIMRIQGQQNYFVTSCGA